MICSRCSLGAALLVEEKRVDPYEHGLHNDMIRMARYMHQHCEYSNCACQHHTNVVEGIDWSKVKGQGKFQHDVQGVTVNGINQNDEKAAREV